MKPDCFLDTNILIFAALGAEDETAKWNISRDIVATKNYDGI